MNRGAIKLLISRVEKLMARNSCVVVADRGQPVRVGKTYDLSATFGLGHNEIGGAPCPSLTTHNRKGAALFRGYPLGHSCS